MIVGPCSGCMISHVKPEFFAKQTLRLNEISSSAYVVCERLLSSKV